MKKNEREKSIPSYFIFGNTVLVSIYFFVRHKGAEVIKAADLRLVCFGKCRYVLRNNTRKTNLSQRGRHH